MQIIDIQELDVDLFYFEDKELITCKLLTFKKEIVTIA